MLLTKLANQEIINFLRTVTIKNSYFADQIAQSCVNPEYSNNLPPEINPYYLHLTGQYILKEPITHWVTDPNTGVKLAQTYKSTQTTTNSKGQTVTISNRKLYTYGFDEMMYVTSLDTKEEIPFTRENLHGCGGNTAIHRKTLEAYKVGSNYFNLLCEKYPKQVDLIKSIVYLIPPKELSASEKNAYFGKIPDEDTLRMQNAIDSKNFSLLQCDDTFLEDREKSSILDCVRSVLEMFRTRWCVNEYVFEENYANVLWSVLWSILPLAIAGQRYANIRGPNAHSSHIWDYLTSHGLDSYRGYLSSEQEAFLYKNIRYLRQHGGEHRILNILVDNLLAEYNLHIEQKSVVYDKSKVLNTVSAGSSYASQCSMCARRSICFKSIKTYKCTEFLGIKETCKPTSVILSEELQGATKKRIITLLKSRYGCSDAEAEFRYNRSFLWKDEAIELIRSELDKDQTIDRGLVTEDLDVIIQREHASELEPIYNDTVVDAQHTVLRHAHSAAIPTKLLEIVEDPTEPKYEEMFTRFLTDSLLHLAPYVRDGILISPVDETFKVTIGQEAVQATLTFGEMLAAMYVGFIREYSPNLIVDTNGAVRHVRSLVNPRDPDGMASVTYTDNRTVLTDFNRYKTYSFKVPSSANIGFTFKLGKPVRQDELVEAFKNADTSLRDLGSYQVTEDVIPDESKEYFIQTQEDYISVGSIEEFDSDVTYYEFVTIPNKVTNGSASEITLINVGGYIYAVKKRLIEDDTSEEYTLWYPYLEYSETDNAELVYAYDILGRFDIVAGSYNYHENNDEIPVIPTYFRWFSKHLGIYEHMLSSEIRKLESPVEGDIGHAWRDKKVYEFSNGAWTDITSGSSNKVDIRKFLKLEEGGTLEYLPAYIEYENIITPVNVDGELKVTNESIYKDIYTESETEDELTTVGLSETDSVISRDVVITGDNSGYPLYCQKEETHSEEYDLLRVDKYLNVDYLINSLYVDALNGINSAESLGEYVDNMFTMVEKLDMIRSSCGDIRTQQAIDTFLKATMIERSTKTFSLLGMGGMSNPTYEDWFTHDPDIGDALKKIDGSEDVEVAWNEFNLKIFSSLLAYCKLSYATSSTSKTKYRKLKELVKSLSSYLVNYIDNEGDRSISTELSHLKEDVSGVKLAFTSYIDFDPICQTFNYTQLGDLDRDLYLPASEVTAKEGVEYYVYNLSSSVGMTDTYGYIKDPVAIGADLREEQRYFKVNLREVLNVDESSTFRVWRVNNQWCYQVGTVTRADIDVETYSADSRATSIAEGVMTDVAQALTGTTKDSSLARYYKQVKCDAVLWNTRTLPASSYGSLTAGTIIPLAAGAVGVVRGIYDATVVVDILLPVGDKCSEYLDLMVRSYHMSSTSEVVNDTSEYVNGNGYKPERSDFLITEDDITRTPRTSQL